MKLLLLSLLCCSPLAALLVAPSGSTTTVHAARTEVVVIHLAPVGDKPGYQELLIRVTPLFEGTPATRLAWIIPLPAAPAAFGNADVATLYAGIGFHPRLFELARQQWADRTEYQWPDAITWLKKPDEPAPQPRTPDLPDLQAADLRNLAAFSPVEMQRWLEANGYAEADLSDTDVKSYLCVEIVPRAGTDRLGSAVEIPPLRVTLDTADPWLPVTNVAPGSLDVTVISDTPLDTNPLMEFAHYFGAKAEARVVLLNLWSVKPLPHELQAELGQEPNAARWYANRIETATAPEKPEKKYPFVVLPRGDLKDELPGFWYYGDTDISFFEKLFREHLLAFTTSAFFLGVLVLFVKARINRARVRGLSTKADSP